MVLIRRVLTLTAAAAAAALVPVTVGACGSSPAPTNGLERKPPAEVLHESAAALKAAGSVHVVGASPSGQVDARIQQGSAAGTLTKDGHRFKVTIIGSDGYVSADLAGLEMMGVPAEVQRLAAGQWLRIPASKFTGFTLAEFATQLTAYEGTLEPKVRQATLDGKQVVVVSWRDGSKLYVANTGPAYPLRGDYQAADFGRIDFTEFGAHFQITAPDNVINVSPTPSHTAQPGEPALLAVPGYEYTDASGVSAAIAKDALKTDPQHFKSASAHNVMREGTVIGGIVLMQLKPQYANLSEVQQAMVPAIVQGLAGSGAKVTQKTIQAEKVAVTSEGSQDIYAWYHGGVMTFVIGESGKGPEIRGFVEAYLKIANA